ncbi:MAG: LysR family transcriptional regulator [Acetivibrio ethanolgignens]
MEIRELITFLQVANQQSFSKAAKILGYTQAAVTIQVKQLETELDTWLFDRIGKQITLTHQGEIFYQYATSILKSIEEARDAVTDSPELNGRLAIGGIESICVSFLPKLIYEYHRLHPKVEISIVTDSPSVLLDQMNKNVLDIVYFMDKRMYDSKWVKVLELPEDIIFVASSNHPYTKKDDLTLSQVIKEPFILTEKNASYRHILDQYLGAYDMEIHPFLESGNTDFLIKLLRTDTGISFLPKFTVQSRIDAGTLAEVKVTDFNMRIWRQIVYHKDKWVTREMMAFLELAKAMS